MKTWMWILLAVAVIGGIWWWKTRPFSLDKTTGTKTYI